MTFWRNVLGGETTCMVVIFSRRSTIRLYSHQQDIFIHFFKLNLKHIYSPTLPFSESLYPLTEDLISLYWPLFVVVYLHSLRLESTSPCHMYTLTNMRLHNNPHYDKCHQCSRSLCAVNYGERARGTLIHLSGEK